MTMIRWNPQPEAALPRDPGLGPFAEEASALLKTLGHEGRLLVLCHLREGPRTVSELQELMRTSQPVVSSHLARLRFEGLVDFRKVGKSASYFLVDGRVRRVLDALDAVFCDGCVDRGA